MSRDIVKFLELDSFINENIEELSDEDYKYLVDVLEQLTQIILRDQYVSASTPVSTSTPYLANVIFGIRRVIIYGKNKCSK